MSDATRSISRQQLRALQTLFGMFARHTVADGDARAARLSWASEALGRAVSSFSELEDHEAAQLISQLKSVLGQENKQRRRPRDRQSAYAHGAHGRKKSIVSIEMLASPEDLQQIEEMHARLGMSRENFEAWLGSRSSPTHGKRELRTVADCNRVRWALKSMLKRTG